MKKMLFLLIVAVFAISFASAASTCLAVNSKTTSAYLNELPSLTSQLATCKILIPSSANFIVKDGDVLVTINMDSGSTENFYITIKNNEVTSFTKGITASYNHQAILSEKTLDSILNSNDAANEVLKGIKNKDIVIKANSFIGKLKLFFAKFLIPKVSTTTTIPTPSVPAGPTGKPDNCDETYLPGHRDYSNNQALWDGYSSDTDKVCQSQYGRGIPSPCIHSVQLSISGNPYYLCWYNE